MRPDVPAVSLSRLRAAGAVAELGSFTAAAAQLHRSQSALSRAVRDLEQSLGLPLFDRGTRRPQPTAAGAVLLARYLECRRALAGLAAAMPSAAGGTARALFRLEVSERTLLAFLALHDSREIAAAAASRGISRTAVYAATAKLEALLGAALFERAAGSLEPTPLGHLLARHAGLVCAILEALADELASLRGTVQGHVAIGTLPYSRTLLTPRAIDEVLRRHPGLRISTREGPYGSLLADLQRGRVDLIVGALRGVDERGQQQVEVLLEDELGIVARSGHPRLSTGPCSLQRLLAYGWILPAEGTPARTLFRDYLGGLGLEEPRSIIETSSLSLARGLLLDSDRVALLSRHQIHYDEQSGLLRAFPLKLSHTVRAIGLTTRQSTAPTPALAALMAAYRSVAARLKE